MACSEAQVVKHIDICAPQPRGRTFMPRRCCDAAKGTVRKSFQMMDVHYIIHATCRSTRLSVIQNRVLIDQLDPFRTKCIWLDERRHVRIKDDILWVLHIVLRPVRNTAVSGLPAIWIKIVDKRGPRLAHQRAEICIALWLVEERIDDVAESIEIVEDE